jgi:signal transduction histidine kinase
MTSFFCESPHETYAHIADLKEDDRFKDMLFVVQEPFVRSVSCVPLRSPKSGVAIGIYAVADNRVRDGLNEAELQFMHDMGLTVMDYLESCRMKRKQYRGEKMVKAIGLFIEGKSTLRESWQELGHMSQGLQRRAVTTVPPERLADAEFGVQDPAVDFTQASLDGLVNYQTSSRSTSSNLYASDCRDGRPMVREPSGASSTDTRIPSSMISQAWHDRQDPVTTIAGTIETVPGKQNSVFSDRPADQPTTADALQVQGTVPSQDLRGVFARASNLIREAIGVEGVVYLDANVASFSGGPARTIIDNSDALAALKIDAILSENDEYRRNIFSETGEESSEHAYSTNDTEAATERCCEVLGFSTRRRSSLRRHPTSQLHRSFPESLLRRLLKRYPHGKAFYFDEDGQVMTDSDPNASSSGLETTVDLKSRPAALKARRKVQSREAEAKAITNVFPGARSVLWYPLWDVNNDRWSVASLIWSTSPSRALDPAEDSTYLAAFSNSIMAEVAKLSAQVLARMKTDFISSISHELRSPLHGVLASVEFLQETEMTEIQADMVSNIHASGKVLLDTINHVLDFSKVNRRSRNRGLVSAKGAKRFKEIKKRDIVDEVSINEYVDISVLSEEVIESVYAGFRVSKHAFGSPANRHLSKIAIDQSVVVILDIARRQYTGFDVDPGALRRILMNLFSNSMKYTKTGFIMITIGIEDGIAPRKMQPSSNLIIKVVDSGKGISQEFLKHRIFKPFEQEDSLASGVGLGLSIIKHIIHDLGGGIDFTSEEGTGTLAKVRIPLIRAPLTPSNPTTNIASDIITEVKNMTKGLKFSLECFEYYPDIPEPPTGILTTDIQAALLLKATTKQIFTDWFGMQATTIDSPFEASSTDVVVVMKLEARNRTLDKILEPYSRNRGIGKKPICIVLCSRYHPTTKTESHEIFNIFYIQGP